MINLCVLLALLSVMSCTFVKDDNPDSALPKDLLASYEHRDIAELTRNDIIESPFRLARKYRSYRWKNNEVPYTLSRDYTLEEALTIQKQMRLLEYYTKSGETYCVRFIPKTDAHVDYIAIKKRGHCSSYVGRLGRGEQYLSLESQCIPDAVIHELMHALGFYHEHQRPDRDKYVKILYENIPDEREGADYNIQNSQFTTTQNISYDYDSVMHYAIEGLRNSRGTPTIVALQHNNTGYIQRLLSIAMSMKDVIRVQRYYGCKEDLTNYNTMSARDIVMDCNFEKDMCNLTQATDDGFDWIRRDTVPDHTYGDGSYLQAITNNHQQQTAALITPYLEPGQYCVALALVGYSEGGYGSVYLYTGTESIKPSYNSSVFFIAISKYSSWTESWYTPHVSVKMTSRWYLRVEAKVRSLVEGTILIDDLLIYKKRQDTDC